MKRHVSKQAKEWPKAVKVGGTVVKVYQYRRTDGAPAYQVADYSTGARRLRNFATPGEAISDAERIARLMAAGEAHAATVNGRDLAGYGRAVELLRPTGVSLEVAAATFARAFEILGRDRLIEAAQFLMARDPANLPRKSVAEVVDELLAVKAARGKSPRYLRDLRTRLARFAHAFKVPVASVTTGDVQRWLDSLKASPQTVKNFRTITGTLFAFAEARGYIAKGQNPVEGTESIRARNGDAVAIYKPEELARLLGAAKSDFVPWLALAAFTGIRSAELVRLNWQDVDLAAGFVTVAADRAKTKARRLVPICDALREWLAPYAGRTGRVWAGGEITLRRRREAAAEAAGVEWKANGLRHSFASYRLAQLGDAARVALEMGNSPGVIFAHYRELVRPETAAAWFAVRPEAPGNVVALGKAVAA